jgi:hypothetical protein
MGRVNIERQQKKGKKSWHRTSVTHDFYVKNNPRQKSGDAAAWATFAPMRLHRQNQFGSMNTSCFFAPSATIGVEVYLHFWQISAPPGICLSVETGGKRAKREKK